MVYTRVYIPGSADVSRSEREGRDSFEPRLVFASPCVPRTSYFNETVCLPFSLPLSLYFLSLTHLTAVSSLLFSSRHLACEPTDRSVSHLARSRLALPSFLPHRFSCSRAPISGGCARFFPPSPPPLVFVRLSQKASYRLRIRRTALMILRYG